MSKVNERIGAVDLYSQTRPLARDEVIEIGNALRWLCNEHVKIFGFDIAMWILWRTPVPKHDYMLMLRRKHMLYAKTMDNVTVTREFFPAKFGDGRCYCCGKRDCTQVGCALARWGSAWARYECWAEEMKWIDSHEFHRRERLTDAWWAMGDRDLVRRSSSARRVLDWKTIEQMIAAPDPAPRRKDDMWANTWRDTYTISAVDNARCLLEAVQDNLASAFGIGMALRLDDIMGGDNFTAVAAMDWDSEGRLVMTSGPGSPPVTLEQPPDVTIANATMYLQTLGIDATNMILASDSWWLYSSRNTKDLENSSVIRLTTTMGAIKARGKWWVFGVNAGMPTHRENTAVVELTGREYVDDPDNRTDGFPQEGALGYVGYPVGLHVFSQGRWHSIQRGAYPVVDVLKQGDWYRDGPTRHRFEWLGNKWSSPL